MTVAMPLTVKLKRWLLQLHLWIGVVFCLPLVAIGLSGSILVYEDAFRAPASVQATAVGATASLDRLLAAAQPAAPNAARPTSLTLPADSGLPAVVGYGGGRGGQQVLLDPVSAEVLGNRNGPPRTPGLMLDIFLLHANFLSGADGRAAVGWFGVVMCLLGVSGLILWWPKRGRFAKAFLVTRGATGWRLMRELHGAIGIWSFAVFMIVSFSGVYIAFPQTTNGLIRGIFQSADPRSVAQALTVSPNGRTAASLDRVAEIARAAVPDARFRAVALPGRAEQPHRVTLSPPGLYADGGPSISVYVDPYEERAIATLDPRQFSLGERIIAWQRPLHAGVGLGAVYKALVFLSGLLPLFFVVTGIAMWLISRRRKAAAAH